MSKALTVRKLQLPTSPKAHRAAQYVRMSTDKQRYSIQNQSAVIAAYAHAHNLDIVRTYADEGESGLRIKNRAGLRRLIGDITGGQADYGYLLVYDVSRWGRFQDTDESAHYEFICRQAGVKVEYCAEQFENDGSMLSSIVKNLKRVMAAEFSRELSVKVHAGQSRIASLGYRAGGPIGFGLRRELVDEVQQSKGALTKGERKFLQTDRVRVSLGSEEEAAVVRWIFHQFVVEQLSYTEIARQLCRRRVRCCDGDTWSDGRVRTILGNENYVGNQVYNRTSRRLGQKLVSNPSHQWVRREGVIEPIVDASLFARARKLMEERRLQIPEDEMLRRLRVLLHRKGKLNTRIIDSAPGVPSVSSLFNHFGSLRMAFARIGYVPKRDCDWIDTRDIWAAVVRNHATKVADSLKSNVTARTEIVAREHTVRVNGKLRITFLVARQAKKRQPGHATHWRVYRRQRLSGLLAILRLDARNREVADYVLTSASEMTKRYLRLSDREISSSAIRLGTLPALIDELKERLEARGPPRRRRH